MYAISGMKERKFSPNLEDALWKHVPKDASPSRILCDLFWIGLPWKQLEESLGRIRIHDIGCGAGRYGANFQKWSGLDINYEGFDIKDSPEWTRNKNENVKFTTFDGESFQETLSGDYNFFVSQSALEHIRYDLKYFKYLQEYIEERQAPILQIHMIPSASCLFLYLLHGYRQYTRRSVGKISEIFGDRCRIHLFRLGGASCNWLHFVKITLPTVSRRSTVKGADLTEYENKVWQAIDRDIQRNSKTASFLALVIESFIEDSIFP